jgi:hypothetical protein
MTFCTQPVMPSVGMPSASSSGLRSPALFPARGFAILLVCVLVLAAGSIYAQSPPVAEHAALGFSYKLPPDWMVAPTHSTLPAAKQNAEQSAKTPGEVLGVACAQPVITAHHGKPPSVIVVVALPFPCYGQPLAANHLSGFATGVSDGLKQNFDVSDPVYGSYTLGTHHFWIERAIGVPKNQPHAEYTLEVACAILKRSAVCWMAMAADADGLRDFENGIVTLDSEPPLTLVPIDAFTKKDAFPPI